MKNEKINNEEDVIVLVNGVPLFKLAKGQGQSIENFSKSAERFAQHILTKAEEAQEMIKNSVSEKIKDPESPESILFGHDSLLGKFHKEMEAKFAKERDGNSEADSDIKLFSKKSHDELIAEAENQLLAEHCKEQKKIIAEAELKKMYDRSYNYFEVFPLLQSLPEGTRMWTKIGFDMIEICLDPENKDNLIAPDIEDEDGDAQLLCFMHSDYDIANAVYRLIEPEPEVQKYTISDKDFVLNERFNKAMNPDAFQEVEIVEEGLKIPFNYDANDFPYHSYLDTMVKGNLNDGIFYTSSYLLQEV